MCSDVVLFISIRLWCIYLNLNVYRLIMAFAWIVKWSSILYLTVYALVT